MAGSTAVKDTMSPSYDDEDLPSPPYTPMHISGVSNTNEGKEAKVDFNLILVQFWIFIILFKELKNSLVRSFYPDNMINLIYFSDVAKPIVKFRCLACQKVLKTRASMRNH